MEDIREAFDAIAMEYDAQRVWVIPDLSGFYGAAVWAAECSNAEPVILDIGAGTGLFSAMILRKFPKASLSLMDLSKNMLSVARQRFAGCDNIRYVVSDYSMVDLGGPYDLVCSALSIHHLTDDAKRRLFGKIYGALKPGGMFVNADQVAAETPKLDLRYREYWDEFVSRGPMTDAEKQEISRRRNTLDRNTKLSTQLAWPLACGFSSVDVIYKNRTFVVMVAGKD
jgi:tRNA (cmo5U34)-methyltransferase